MSARVRTGRSGLSLVEVLLALSLLGALLCASFQIASGASRGAARTALASALEARAEEILALLVAVGPETRERDLLPEDGAWAEGVEETLPGLAPAAGLAPDLGTGPWGRLELACRARREALAGDRLEGLVVELAWESERGGRGRLARAAVVERRSP